MGNEIIQANMNLGQVQLTGQLADNPALIGELISKEVEAIWQADPSFLAIKARENASVPLPYFVDFVKKAQLTGADPRLNQIYMVPAKKKCQKTNRWIDAANVVFAYQFFMDKASRTGLLESFKVETKIEEYFVPSFSNGQASGRVVKTLVSTCTVKRKNVEVPVVYKARFPEFAKDTMTWNKMPYIMLEKCSIANAFRWAFPEALSGIYISEEMTGEPNPPSKKDEPKKQGPSKQELAKTQQTYDEKLYDELISLISTLLEPYKDQVEKEKQLKSIYEELGVEGRKDLLDKPEPTKKEMIFHLREQLKKARAANDA